MTPILSKRLADENELSEKQKYGGTNELEEMFDGDMRHCQRHVG